MPPEVLSVAEPRWDGDCVHCAALGCPPGYVQPCERCHQPVCIGHALRHERDHEGATHAA